MGGRRTAVRPAAAWLLVVLCGTARAEGLDVWIEPTYGHSENEAKDATGRKTTTVVDQVTQSYRANFDRRLTEYLSLSLGGNLLDERAWSGENGHYVEAGGRAISYYARLTLGTPVLNCDLSATRNERQSFSSGGFVQAGSPTFVTESYVASASWRPLDLPEFGLRFAHVNEFDSARLTRDASSDNAAFTVRYTTQSSDLRYLFNWFRVDDHLQDTLTTTIEQMVLGSRMDRFLDGRVTTYVSATGHYGTTSTEARGAGIVTRQQLPFNGLSAIEAFPATAVNIQLVPNSLLVDGNLGTTAGLDVGFGPSAAGDRNPRDVGAAFADALTPVNTLYVWFDRTLSTEVGSALAASAAVYRSDDNRNWTAVPVVAPPFASPFSNRIEVTIAQTQAQYVKVVLVPIAVGVTTDISFRDVFVTEIQLFLSLPASQVPTHQTIGGAMATGTARTVILRDPELVWDLTGTVGRQRDGPTTYSVMNGLSATQRLSRTVAANERVARVDENLGVEHEGSWQWSAGLVWKPVPTAYGNLTYSGYSKDGGDLQNAIAVLGRADWYEGISTQGNASVARVSNPDRTTDSFDASGRVQLTPNPWVSVAAGAQYNRSFTTSLTLGDFFAQYLRVDGSLTLTPVPALTATGTVSRLVYGVRPTTFGTVELNYYPLRGDLQFNFTYSRTFDTANQLTSEYYIPSLRWNVSRHVSLRSSYTYSTNEIPVLSIVSRVFLISLLVAL